MTASADHDIPRGHRPGPGLDVHRRWQLLALLAVLGTLVWLLAPVLTPFAIAALLAWLGDPLVDRLESRGAGRTLAVCIVFAVMIGVLTISLILLIPLLERQIGRLIEDLPRYGQWLRETVVPWLEARLKLDLGGYLDPRNLIEVIKTHWQQAGGVATMVLGHVSRSGLAVLTWLANLLLLPVVTFYFLRDWDVMVSRLHALLPRAVEPTVSRLARESNDVLGAFMRGQLIVMVALGVIYAVGLTVIGIDLGVLIGLIAGLVSFVPYLGVITGLVLAVIAALFQYGDWMHLLGVAVVFSVGQTLEGFVLTPKIVGDRIGIPPVGVIFAVLAGGQLFGFLGVLLALPVAAVTMVLLRYGYARYTASALYGDPPADDSAGQVVLVESSARTDEAAASGDHRHAAGAQPVDEHDGVPPAPPGVG